MKREQKTDNDIKRIMKGRAARTLAAAVSVFLCILTLFGYAALRMEWDVPALAVISGGNGFWSGVYQKEELAFDDSTENILLADEGEVPEDGKRQRDDVTQYGAEASDAGKAQDGGTGAETFDVGKAQDGGTGADTGEEKMSEGAETDSGTGENAQESDAPQDGKEASDVGETKEELEFPYYIRINRRQNCITVYTPDEDGEYTVPYKAMICSTGLYNATPRGTYQISTKYLWRELYGGVYGQYATRIHGGVLFHSVPYYSRSKNSLCTDKYNKLGQQASMGCVRLTVEDAKWIAENCPEGTTVEIYDDDDPGPLGKPEAMKIDSDNPNRGWDPTDPDEDNPWHEASQDE